jgi:hypothetical protein
MRMGAGSLRWWDGVTDGEGAGVTGTGIENGEPFGLSVFMAGLRARERAR